MADYKLYLISFTLGITAVWVIKAVNKTAAALRSPAVGPKFAKLTVLWKIINIRNRTYTKRLRELHKYSGVIQVGPGEFSIGNPQLLGHSKQLEKLVPDTLLISPEVTRKLPATLQMANIFRYEPLLEKCNHALLCALLGHAENEEEVNLAELVARYAYDTMFCTTTGSAPGFLDRRQDISKLLQAMENWKFYGVLFGSYHRFTPFLRAAVSNTLKKAVSKHLDLSAVDDGPCVANELNFANDSPEDDTVDPKTASFEASMALMTSGADPVITHLLSAIYFTYQDAELVEALREEIDKANLGQPPKLKELIHAKARMPLLHAVLQESLRLIETPGVSYVSPKGGVTVGGVNVPEACTICCEPSVAHVNPNIFGTSAEAFDPSRWIEDPSVARGFRNHMITFGAGTDTCPGKDFHLSIVAKVLTQIVTYFNFEMGSVQASKSPVNLTFNDFKQLTIAKVVIPKNIRPIITGLVSPLRATAPSFSPVTTTAPELPPGFTPKKVSFGDHNGEIDGSFKVVGNYATRIGDVVDFVPNAMAHGENGDLTSPTLSDATTAKSSEVSSTPITWADEQTLEDIIGRELTNKLMTDFDPTTELTPRPLLRTDPISEPRTRALLHEVVERVWDGRLNHKTSRKENSMYIWVPGSRLPKWLFYLCRNERKKELNSQVSQATNVTAAAPPKAPRAINPTWDNFANDENARYTKVAAMSGEEFIAAERKKAEENGEKTTEDAPRAPAFKETFKQTGTKAIDDTSGSKDASAVINDTTNIEPKKATLPPHLRARATTPPHLRSKSVDSAMSETKDAEIATENAEWCATKLPSPCSSD